MIDIFSEGQPGQDTGRDRALALAKSIASELSALDPHNCVEGLGERSIAAIPLLFTVLNDLDRTFQWNFAAHRWLVEIARVHFAEGRVPLWGSSILAVATKAAAKSENYKTFTGDLRRYFVDALTCGEQRADAVFAGQVGMSGLAGTIMGLPSVPATTFVYAAHLLERARVENPDQAGDLLRALALTSSGFVATSAKRRLLGQLVESLDSRGNLSHADAIGAASAYIGAWNLVDAGAATYSLSLLKRIASARFVPGPLDSEILLALDAASVLSGEDLLANVDLTMAMSRIAGAAVSSKPEVFAKFALTCLTLDRVIDGCWSHGLNAFPHPNVSLPSVTSYIAEKPITESRVAPPRLAFLDFAVRPKDVAPSEAFAETIEVARHLDQLGFSRYWLAEHYSISMLWGSQIPVIPIIASNTSRIRVGAAGVILEHHNVLEIAASFNVYAHAFPDRIDLGLARGLPWEGNAAVLEDNVSMSFEERFDILIKLFDGGFDANHRYARAVVLPLPPRKPDIWLLGTSQRSVQLAKERQVNYSHSIAHSPRTDYSALADFIEQPRPGAPTMQANLAVAGVCSASRKDSLSSLLATSLFTLHPTVYGDRSECRERILQLCEESHAAEIVFVDLSPTAKEKMKSLERLADAVR